jgi:signal transduction histidine kinase
VSEARRRPRRFSLRWLRDPAIVGWPLFWLTLGAWTTSGFVSALRNFSQLTSDAVSTWFFTMAAGHAVLFIFLILARCVWWDRAWPKKHPVVAFGSIAFGVILGVSTSNTIATALIADHDSVLFALGYVPFGVIAVVGLASAVGYVRHHRENVEGMYAEQVGLQASLEASRETLALERTHTLHVANQAVSEALEALNGTRQEAVDQLNRTSAEVLRPLSHQLVAKSRPTEPATPPKVSPRWREVFDQLSKRPPIAPLATAMLVTFLASRLTIRDIDQAPPQLVPDPQTTGLAVSVDWDSFAEAISQLGVIFGSVLLMAWITLATQKQLLTRLQRGGRWLAGALGILFVAAGSQISIGVFFAVLGIETDFGYTSTIAVYVALVITFVASTLGLIRAVKLAQQDILQQWEKTNSGLQRQLARLQQEVWDQRRQLAFAIHGPLRSALVSCAMQLNNSIEKTDDLTQKLATRIRDAHKSMLNPVSELALTEKIGKLADLWSGTCEIDIDIDPSTAKRLRNDTLTSSTIHAVVDEALANAITHSGATAIHVLLASTRSEVEVTVVNDITTHKPQSTKGLGTTLLDDVTLRWSLLTGDQEVTLVAVIPLSMQESSGYPGSARKG